MFRFGQCISLACRYDLPVSVPNDGDFLTRKSACDSRVSRNLLRSRIRRSFEPALRPFCFRIFFTRNSLTHTPSMIIASPGSRCRSHDCVRPGADVRFVVGRSVCYAFCPPSHVLASGFFGTHQNKYTNTSLFSGNVFLVEHYDSCFLFPL